MTERTEKEKLRVGVGQEQAFCFGHTNLEMPIRNPHGNIDLDMSLELRSEIRR